MQKHVYMSHAPKGVRVCCIALISGVLHTQFGMHCMNGHVPAVSWTCSDRLEISLGCCEISSAAMLHG